MWHDSNRRNYPVPLKFDKNVYVLYEISCIVFGVPCPNRMYRDAQNYLKILGPIEGNSLKSILTWLPHIKWNLYKYSDAQWNSLFRKWVFIGEIVHVPPGIQKNNNTLLSIKTIFKSILT